MIVFRIGAEFIYNTILKVARSKFPCLKNQPHFPTKKKTTKNYLVKKKVEKYAENDKSREKFIIVRFIRGLNDILIISELFQNQLNKQNLTNNTTRRWISKGVKVLSIQKKIKSNLLHINNLLIKITNYRLK